MRVDSWFRRHWFFAFPLPFFRLRHVFGTPSARLRDRSGKALGLSNLRSDSPLDFVDIGRSYLGYVAASNSYSTSGSLGGSYVVLANGVPGLLFDTDSSGQALVLDRKVHCRPERSECWDNQPSTNAWVHNFSQPVPFPCAQTRVCFWNMQRDSSQLGTGSHNRA
jgi:hypothetical protein